MLEHLYLSLIIQWFFKWNTRVVVSAVKFEDQKTSYFLSFCESRIEVWGKRKQYEFDGNVRGVLYVQNDSEIVFQRL